MSGAAGGGGKRGVSWPAGGNVTRVANINSSAAAVAARHNPNRAREEAAARRNVSVSHYAEGNLARQMSGLTLKGGRRKTRRRSKKARKTRRNY